MAFGSRKRRRAQKGYPPIDFSHTDGTSSTSNLTTYNFASRAIGAAHPYRRVYVQVNWDGTNALSSATIGGISATIHSQVDDGAGGSAIISALVPTGTTATIVITLNASGTRCGIEVWRATYTDPTPHHSASDLTEPLSVSINVAKGGFILGNMHSGNASSVVWAGIVEQSDYPIEGSSQYSFAAQSGLAQETGRTVSNDANSGSPFILVTSFKPLGT